MTRVAADVCRENEWESGTVIKEAIDITERLRQEFRVRSWWPGMDEFDSARGETEPHPVALEAATEIDLLRVAVVELISDADNPWSSHTDIGRAVDRALGSSRCDDQKVRRLVEGSIIHARPCVVTITHTGESNGLAHGYCEVCEAEHIIERWNYEDGEGPWKPVPLVGPVDI